jgi:hypothetical protein
MNRSSSASRENDQQPSPPVVSSTEKLKDRFYSWHRKSEPYCSLTLPSKLSQLFSSSSERRNSANNLQPQEQQPQPSHREEPLCTEEEEEEGEPTQPSSPRGRQASLEEIVGEIVMQNVPRAVRRSRSLGRPRDAAAADSSSDCEHRSPRQRLRAQRLARMCALRTQQENIQRTESSRPLSFLQQWHMRNQQKLARSQEDDEEHAEEKLDTPEPLQIVESQDPPPLMMNYKRGSTTSLESKCNLKRMSAGESQERIATPGSPGKRSPSTPTRSPSFLGVLASFGSKLIVNSQESLQTIEALPESPRPCPTPMYKQGSRSLGARIANNCSSDYANPQTLIFKNEEDEEDFYEDSLSAVLDQEEFYRDSAIFSDEHEEPTPKPVKIPPPVPAKPVRVANGGVSKSAEVEDEPAKPKGWVKQMVGRIQAGAES